MDLKGFLKIQAQQIVVLQHPNPAQQAHIEGAFAGAGPNGMEEAGEAGGLRIQSGRRRKMLCVRARSSSLARAKAGRCREWRRRRKYLRMDRPSFTLRLFDGSAIVFRAADAVSGGVRGAQFLDRQRERRLQLLLGRLVEFGATEW